MGRLGLPPDRLGFVSSLTTASSEGLKLKESSPTRLGGRHGCFLDEEQSRAS